MCTNKQKHEKENKEERRKNNGKTFLNANASLLQNMIFQMVQVD
jgi:hypothetical protein